MNNSQISLPEDSAPHTDSNIEWWYFFTFLNGSQGSQYALMASFFRVGEFDFKKGHYLIYTLINLKDHTKINQSIVDSNLKLNMISIYLPFYLLLHPTDTQIWKLYKSLILGQIPKPHKKMKKVSIDNKPTKLNYGNKNLIFLGESQESFKTKLVDHNLEIDLHFTPTKPVALIGGDGKPGDLYYYSFTKNDVEGHITTDSGMESVIGQGWFDHQWGRDYSLITGKGWNWFGLQLEDGRELLLNEMMSSEGTLSPMANLIEKDGSVRYSEEISFEELRYWKSLKTNARYPIEWKITIPEFSMELHVVADFSNQEMLIIGPIQAIWEGACRVTGHENLSNGRKKSIEGKGFMELVGYAMHNVK